MTPLHIVYRVYDEDRIGEDWAVYSFPASIFTGGARFDDVAQQVTEMLPELVDYDTPVIDHVERPVFPGAWVRVALDDHREQRASVAAAVHAMFDSGLQGSKQRAELESQVPLAASGDVVLICCVPGDTIEWVLQQMAPQDTVAVCSLGPVVGDQRLVYWNYLVREGVGSDQHRAEREESLSEAGLRIESSISTFIQSDSHSSRRGLRVGV